MTEPLVTVLIPTYNRADMLPTAIDSILNQTLTDFELIVVDDGGTDNTPEVMKRYTDPRVRYEPQSINRGGCGARNVGIDLARGKYFAMLDSDDAALPHRLATQIDFLERNPDIALVGSEKRPLKPRFSFRFALAPRPYAPEHVDARLLFRCAISHPTVTARTDAMRRFRYDESFALVEDYDLFARMAGEVRIANLPDVLVAARFHPAQLSHRRAEVAVYQKKIMVRRLAELGITPSPRDLERHFLLARPLTWFAPTRPYLAWARDWLAGLQQANREVKRYDEAAFARVCDELTSDLWRKMLAGMLKPGANRQIPA